MPSTLLTDRAVILVTGSDAESLLQGIITTDLDGLPEGEARPGALLSPQGKILFDFLVSRIPQGGLRLELQEGAADALLKRLALYRLRAKVELARADDVVVEVSWGDHASPREVAAPAESVRDARFTGSEVTRRYSVRSASLADRPASEWHAFRIASGVPESGADYALGEAFPHDVLLDQNNGVGFRKGCYVGQEVVSRMHHRGTARRRMLMVDADADLPPAGTPLTVEARNIGTMGSSDGRRGLAIARIDHVADALGSGKEIMAGAVPVRLRIPDWATFSLPDVSEGT